MKLLILKLLEKLDEFEYTFTLLVDALCLDTLSATFISINLKETAKENLYLSNTPKLFKLKRLPTATITLKYCVFLLRLSGYEADTCVCFPVANGRFDNSFLIPWEQEEYIYY